MYQGHTIILWKKPDDEKRSFKSISKQGFETLNVFFDYKKMYRPNYLTVYRKKDAKPFEWTYENFENELKENMVGEDIFKDLGYSISFFSSLRNKDAFGFSMYVGNTNIKFVNDLSVNIAYSLDLQDEKIAKNIEEIFNKTTNIFEPYWGCVSNNMTQKKYGRFLIDEYPSSIHWLNYFDEEMIDRIGEAKINEIVSLRQGNSFKNNVLKIKNTALDLEKEEDILYQEKINEILKKDKE